MLLQIFVTMKAMPWYTALPSLSEHMVENGWTKCFSRISDVGWLAYLVYLVTYLVIVEFGIYWMHRELHDIKPLYKYLHATHHVYNKQNTLSPFAGKFSIYWIQFPWFYHKLKLFGFWMLVCIIFCLFRFIYVDLDVTLLCWSIMSVISNTRNNLKIRTRCHWNCWLWKECSQGFLGCISSCLRKCQWNVF